MKKVVVSLLTIAVASFVYFFNPDFSFAAGQYDCSGPGVSCQGVTLQVGWYNNGSNPLWVDAGKEIYYGFTNDASSNHSVNFWISGPNGWTSYSHVATPGASPTFSSVAPYSGYYVLHVECNYGNSTDCSGYGEEWRY